LATSPERHRKRAPRQRSFATPLRPSDHAVANLRLEVEDFLGKVAV
jgi:hypothetical protein